ncbi:MAG: hypothetical protein IJ031_00545 [Oscillospiraceae bacterium]|nr:hypothetical protein [Oscillospiraceae bacterium]MBQ8377698.1 hypothetical protein [Oscillospiraceae bacterium]MBQ8883075.1 hypothetical protein [Oscillospiraceae bacterium]
MRKPQKHSSGFLISLVFNLIMNFEVALVAIALLILHFVIDLPLIFFFIALGVWIIPNLVITLFLFVLAGMDTTTEYRDNKNPYSNGNNKPQIPENKNPYSKS